jgi:hypothetical protein
LKTSPEKSSGFIRVFLAVCSGTDVFLELLRFPVPRALAHFLTLTFLVSFFIAAAGFFSLYSDAAKVCRFLEEKFGPLTIDGGGIHTGSPNAREHYILGGGLGFDYYPPGWKPEDEKHGEKGSAAGLIMTDRLLAFWTTARKDQYMVLPLIYPESAKIRGSYVGGAEFGAYVKNLSSAPGGLAATVIIFSVPLGARKFLVNIENIKFPAALAVSALRFLAAAAMTLFSGITFSLIFSMVYSITGGGDDGSRGKNRLKAASLFVVALYAGFPALVIAAFFPALNLGVLDFQTVYLICFLVYLFVVFGRIQKSLAPPKNDEPPFD